MLKGVVSRNTLSPLLTLYQTTKFWISPNFTAFADDKIIVTHELKFMLGRVENIVGKGENAGYQHFLLFPQCFQKLSFPEVLKVVIVW